MFWIRRCINAMLTSFMATPLVIRSIEKFAGHANRFFNHCFDCGPNFGFILSGSRQQQHRSRERKPRAPAPPTVRVTPSLLRSVLTTLSLATHQPLLGIPNRVLIARGGKAICECGAPHCEPSGCECNCATRFPHSSVGFGYYRLCQGKRSHRRPFKTISNDCKHA